MKHILDAINQLAFFEGEVINIGSGGLWVRNHQGVELFFAIETADSVALVGHPVKLVCAPGENGDRKIVRLENLATLLNWNAGNYYIDREDRHTLSLSERFAFAFEPLRQMDASGVRLWAWLLPAFNYFLLMMLAIHYVRYGFWRALKYNALGLLLFMTIVHWWMNTPLPPDMKFVEVGLMLFLPVLIVLPIGMLAAPDIARPMFIYSDAVDRLFGEPQLIDTIDTGTKTTWVFIAIVLAVLGFNLSKEFKKSHRLFFNDMSWLIENPRNRKTTYDLSPEQLARWEATHGKAIAELKAQAKNPSPPPAIAPAPVPVPQAQPTPTLEEQNKAREAAAKAEEEKRQGGLKPALGTWTGVLSDGRTRHTYSITNDMQGSVVKIVSDDGFSGVWQGTWSYHTETKAFRINPKNRQDFDRYTPARGKEHYRYTPSPVAGGINDQTMELASGNFTGVLTRQ